MNTRRWFGTIAALALVSLAPAFAADPETAAPSSPSPEVRQQMAAVHQKMAECLRSDRSIADCQAEMINRCRAMMGAGGCPMMGPMGVGMGPGMMGRGMMGGGSAPEPGK